MRKLYLFATVFFFIISYTHAQYFTTPIETGNPSNKNSEDLEYPVGGGLPTTWTVIHAGSAATPVWSTNQTLPFPFDFNGITMLSYKVSTSGVLTFTTNAGTAPSSINTSLPSSSIPNNSICVWGISGKGSNDKIVTKTFGTAPNRQVWISFNDYSIPILFGAHYTYWSIVLEESTNHIYFVDQRKSNGLTTALTLGVQINSTTAISVFGSPSINTSASDSPTRTDNIYYTLEPGNQPNTDVKGLNLILDNIIVANQGPFTIKFVYQNIGSDTITQLDLNYSNSGSLKTTGTINGLNILPWQIDTLEHPITWSPSAGTTTLKAWAENINGTSDENPSNDTAQHPVIIVAQSADRVPLLESFTSSTSPPSKAFNNSIQATLNAQTGAAVHIKYPMNWPGTGDPYYTNEGGTRRQYYAVSSLPNLQLDGTDWSNFNYNLNTSTLSSARNKMALLDIDAIFYVNGTTICTDISIDPLIDFSNSNLTLYVAVYEKQVSNNVKSSGDSQFYNVMKKMLPNANGTSIPSLLSGVLHQESFCFTFNGSYVLPTNATQPVNLATNHTIEEFADLGVAAWLQDDVTKEILQATEAYSTIGTGENLNVLQNIKVFPNPTSSEVFIALNVEGIQELDVNLVSITGQNLLQNSFSKVSGEVLIPISLPQLSAGIYILNIRVNDIITSQKLIIE